MNWQRIVESPLLVKLLASALLAVLLANPLGALLVREWCGSSLSIKAPVPVPSRPATLAPVVE